VKSEDTSGLPQPPTDNWTQVEIARPTGDDARRDRKTEVMTTDDVEYAQLVRDLNERCRLSGEFTLRSGRSVDTYFDKYLFESDPSLLAGVARRMTELVPRDVQLLGALELGGVPLATLLSHMTGLPMVFVRKQAKAYGTRRLVEGPDPSGRTVLLVEDVITTGGAVLHAARALRGQGASVGSVVCAIDRAEGCPHPLAAHSLEVRSVMSIARLDAAATNSETMPIR
jgi:orotate phosphoribosyltransferase